MGCGVPIDGKWRASLSVRSEMKNASLDKISKVYWLLEDCKRFGTLPFAGLARAGFIATQLLRSIVTVGVLDESEYAAFMANLDTVGAKIGRDFFPIRKGRVFTALWSPSTWNV